jgi:hypothetical protein
MDFGIRTNDGSSRTWKRRRHPWLLRKEERRATADQGAHGLGVPSGAQMNGGALEVQAHNCATTATEKDRGGPARNAAVRRKQALQRLPQSAGSR